MKRVILFSLSVSFAACFVLAQRSDAADEELFRLGWIGALTGPIAAYGTGDAARLAMDDINAEGGIQGRKLALIMEDGQGKGASALSAFQKLTAVDHIKFIIGGHCTPESAAIAPLSAQRETLILAAVTSSPSLTGVSPNFFRISQVNLVVGELLAQYAWNQPDTRRAAVLAEETDYVLPTSRRFAEAFRQKGGSVHEISFQQAETDFRSLLLNLKASSPDIIYIGTQTPDTARMLLQQYHELGLAIPLLGNEITGNAASGDSSRPSLFSGLVYAEPQFDLERPETEAFVNKFKARYHTDALPNGIWTAEAYDAVRIMAKALNECGSELEDVKRCLYRVRDYQGASGPITIGPNRDGLRKTALKRVRPDGRSETL